MRQEIIKRFWRIAYSNSCRFRGHPDNELTAFDIDGEWEATRIVGPFYWVTDFWKHLSKETTTNNETYELSRKNFYHCRRSTNRKNL